MTYFVEYSPNSFADLEKLNKTAQERITKKIDWLTDKFDEITPQALTSNLSGFYKLRVGDYRVIYETVSQSFLISD